MEILFKQLGRLTKVAPVYGNHENKIKFTRNKLNHKKNNIIILNDQEVQLNNITLIGRKNYTNKNRKKTLKIMSTFNSTDILITDKCFHSLILTIYNPILRVITAKKHSNTTSSGLVGWGFPI